MCIYPSKNSLMLTVGELNSTLCFSIEKNLITNEVSDKLIGIVSFSAYVNIHNNFLQMAQSRFRFSSKKAEVHRSTVNLPFFPYRASLFCYNGWHKAALPWCYSNQMAKLSTTRRFHGTSEIAAKSTATVFFEVSVHGIFWKCHHFSKRITKNITRKSPTNKRNRNRMNQLHANPEGSQNDTKWVPL